MTADISVLICAYTEARWNNLVAAVDSVQRQQVPPREIIVVIDHNPSLLERTRAEIPGIVVLENRLSRGLAGARNSGVASAQGLVIAFLDDDAIADPDWLAQLLRHYADARVAGVGGAVLPDWSAGRPRWFPEESDWVVGCTYRGLPEVAAPIRNFIGCNMSFRREVFDAVGGFHTGLGRMGTVPLGCEETELCVRLQQHWPSRRLLYEPEARVRHHVPVARSCWQYFRARCYAEGRSKALVSELVGAREGLATERSYTLRTLPKALWRSGFDAPRHGDPTFLGRALAIVFGLGITASGYGTARLASRVRRASYTLAPVVPGVEQHG